MNPVTDPRQQLEQMKLGDPSLQVEEASPISSRPPAMATHSSASTAAGLFEDELLAGGSGSGGVGGGNRWPRQETIALLKIRLEMDTAFKDANPKGPLWEEVSRKLGELGYKRNAKKCKEKFENVHKYYKRTKEGRAGRQDGKSYKFFTELEALTSPSMQIPLTVSVPPPPPAATAAAPVSSSIRFQPPVMFSVTHHPQPLTLPDFNPVAPGPTPNIGGISFSSDTASFASDSSDDDMEMDEDDFPGGGEVGKDRKRKRTSSPGRTDETMMEFFERLMKRVLQKQEAMQQRFLEAIESREQDRMRREEAWKRQEVARYSREHELMAQERAVAASRDAAIISFLQKISGQTHVQLPPAISVPFVVPPAPPTPTPQPPAVSMPPPSSTPVQVHQSPQLHQQQQQLACLEPVSKPSKYQRQQQHQQIHQKHHQTPISVDHHNQVLMAIPEQQIPPPQHKQQQQQEIGTSIGSGSEPSSSRWPKAEILALIQLRSGLEYRYLESGPKGPLWEDISAGMQRMGYKRNAKRCKEKWENINKYYKKVKESNKKRPEDAKTCPYYHQLDELYRNRILGAGPGGGFPIVSQNKPDEQVGTISDPVLAVTLVPQEKSGGNSEIKTSYGGLTATLFGEGSSVVAAASGDKKPEDRVNNQLFQNHQQEIMGDYESDDLDQDDDDDGEDDVNNEDGMKMGYKIDFQGQNTSASSNGGGNGGSSFLTMVQ